MATTGKNCHRYCPKSFDSDAAKSYGELRGTVERSGQVLGPLDMLIAAHALAENATIVTNNERVFRRINRLARTPTNKYGAEGWWWSPSIHFY